MQDKNLSVNIYTKKEIDDLINDLKKPTVYIKGIEKRELKRWEGVGHQIAYIFKNLEFETIIGIENNFGTGEFRFKAPYESSFYFDIQIALNQSGGDNPLGNFQTEQYQLISTFTEHTKNKSVLKNISLFPYSNYLSNEVDKGILLGSANTCLYLKKDEIVSVSISCQSLKSFPDNTIILPKHTYIIVSS